MGKIFNYLAILIFVDLVFIVTAQNISSLSSIIINSLLNIENITSMGFFSELIGDVSSLFNSGTGIASLLVTAAVGVGFFFSSSDTKFFVPIALSLALIAGDMVVILVYLISLNLILGMFLFAPLIILYYFCVVEWLRGKD
jgi:hypothetical protein